MSTSWKDKENRRKCFKCGKSPVADNIKLFRFPKPAVRNLLRCTLWAKFMFPMEESRYSSVQFLTMLFNEHRMLCQDHFLEKDFLDESKQKLLRDAVPYIAEDLMIPQPFFDASIPGPSQVPSYPQAGTSRAAILLDIGNRSELSLISPKQLSEPLPGPVQIMECIQTTTSTGAISADIKIKDSSIVRLSVNAAVESEPGPSNLCTLKTQSVSSGGTVSLNTGSREILNICEIGESQRKNIHEAKLKTKKEKELYNKCAKYMRQLCQLRNKTKNLKKKVMLNELTESNAFLKLSKKLTPTFSLLLQGQIRNSKKKATGKRWTKNEKIVALRLFKRSPTCYRLMRRLFHLPAPSTLKALLNKVPFSVGASEAVMNVLKNYTKTASPSDNNFILMFDEMSIKKNLNYNRKDDMIEGFQDHGTQGRSQNVASYALVFMVSGIRKKVKQPIAHYFSSSYSSADRLAVLLKELLNKCLEAGLNIVATVCDMDGVNRRALSILGATSEKPQIKIKDQEIITIFDTPHLLKCFRNLFMKYDIQFATEISSSDKMGIGTAKWSHIKSFYEMDNKNSTFVFAPALTKDHLNPNAKQKMRVKLAAQVLSHSVAAGLFAKISDGVLTTEAAATANLVANIDKLFDCLNSDCSDLRRGKIHATNMKENTPHKEMLNKMNHIFKNMKFLGSPRPPPSQEGWTWTINGVKKIFDSLSKKYKIKSLATRRLQQDPLENLFGCIRGNCGSNANPTAGQFVAGLKTAILSNLAHLGTTGNCESDSNVIIDNFDKFLSDSHSQRKTKRMDMDDISSETIDFLEETIDFDELNTEDYSFDEGDGNIQACAYVCGFLLKKLPIDKCHTCKHMFLSSTVEKFHLFVEAKEYHELNRSLNYCKKILVEIVESCASFINKYLEENAHATKLKMIVLEAVQKNVNFEYFKRCSTHGTQNVKTLLESVFFICIKRFCVCKNRSFAEEASASALKRKMNIILHK